MTLAADPGRTAGASLQIEAHMSHPGMAPVVAPARALGGGRYEASLVLPMAGPWMLVASGTTADGTSVTASYPITVSQ